MEFDIGLTRNALAEGDIQIKKGEGITYALFRAGYKNADNPTPTLRELKKAYTQISQENRTALLDLAKEVSDTIPFKNRKKNTKDGLVYLTKEGEILYHIDTSQQSGDHKSHILIGLLAELERQNIDLRKDGWIIGDDGWILRKLPSGASIKIHIDSNYNINDFSYTKKSTLDDRKDFIKQLKRIMKKYNIPLNF